MTDKKVVIISGVQCITRNKPVKIFRIKYLAENQISIMMRCLMELGDQ